MMLRTCRSAVNSTNAVMVGGFYINVVMFRRSQALTLLSIFPYSIGVSVERKLC